MYTFRRIKNRRILVHFFKVLFAFRDSEFKQRFLANVHLLVGNHFRQRRSWGCRWRHQGPTSMNHVLQDVHFLVRRSLLQLVRYGFVHHWSQPYKINNDIEEKLIFPYHVADAPNSLSLWMNTYAKLYPPTPMLSFSYFKTVASFGSTGTASATARTAAKTKANFILSFVWCLLYNWEQMGEW